MALRYSNAMRMRHPSCPSGRLPRLWLLSDARTDAALGAALRRLPRGSGFIFRHYHLPAGQRAARFRQLRRLCLSLGHCAVLAGSARAARAAGADGCYGTPRQLAAGPRLLRLAAAHTLREIAASARARADAVLLSPVFATRSHPGARGLGPLKFRQLARRAAVPVIALGGMNPRSARRLPGFAWAAIDGLAAKKRGIPKDS